MLKDELDLVRDSEPWEVKPAEIDGEKFAVILPEKTPGEVKVTFKRGEGAKDVQALALKKFGDLLALGMSPKEAAAEMGTPMHLLVRGAKAKEKFASLVAAYELDDQTTKRLVRAARLKVLDEAEEAGDHRLVLETTKQIATDPAVGLTGGPLIAVQQNNIIGDSLREMMSKLGKDDAIIEAEEVRTDGSKGRGSVEEV